MIQTMKPTYLACLAALVFAASCATSLGSEDEEIADKAVSLGYVAVAVDGFVRYGSPAPDLTGPALVREATSQNPELLEPLAGYYLTARQENGLTSVLMCDDELTRAIAEDSGCTSARLDAPIWRNSPGTACEFQLVLDIVCER